MRRVPLIAAAVMFAVMLVPAVSSADHCAARRQVLIWSGTAAAGTAVDLTSSNGCPAGTHVANLNYLTPGADYAVVRAEGIYPIDVDFKAIGWYSFSTSQCTATSATCKTLSLNWDSDHYESQDIVLPPTATVITATVFTVPDGDVIGGRKKFAVTYQRTA